MKVRDLENGRLRDICIFLVVCDKEIVIDLFLEVEISESLLIMRLVFDKFFELLYIKFAYRIKIFVYFSDDNLLLFS